MQLPRRWYPRETYGGAPSSEYQTLNSIPPFGSWIRFLSSIISRSSHQSSSVRKGVLGNFTNVTRKHLCKSLFFNKVAGNWHRCLPVNFAKFLRTPFFQNTSGSLLLNFITLFRDIIITIFNETCTNADSQISLYVWVRILDEVSNYLPLKFVFFLKSRLLFNDSRTISREENCPQPQN